MADFFTVHHEDAGSRARTGTIHLPHGPVSTPVFMPVGTNATVKALTKEDLEEIGFEIILSNTYHLYLRPGTDVFAPAGGLHSFMHWDRNILTDSGGFQVFSLAPFRKITMEGALFRSHIDGSSHFLSPEKTVDIQALLGSDIQMQLDYCTGYGVSRKEAETALDITEHWLSRANSRWKEQQGEGYRGNLFSIVQGNFFKDLRERSAASCAQADTPGIAIGGLSVGEPANVFEEYLAHTTAFLPRNKPRYVMGIGTPQYILAAIANGVDMFDCVAPTREGRNGRAYTHQGPLSIKKAENIRDFSPIDEACDCKVCRTYSRAYLRHLFKAQEILCSMLVSYHNLYFLHNLVKKAREAITQDRLSCFINEFMSVYAAGTGETGSGEA
ncbi:MAG: tRNA guanosine(34) transglycosylase Tgt [Treponema sp.]|jgi:queuine tRNA-ribosyltransferase|nr:tRNA guanosine(34) transglycosylase Tgt [Treponema sp.]